MNGVATDPNYGVAVSAERQAEPTSQGVMEPESFVPVFCSGCGGPIVMEDPAVFVSYERRAYRCGRC